MRLGNDLTLSSSSILIVSILMGGMTGCYFPSSTPYLKPIGEVFLRLLLTIIIPLVFFSVSAALVKMQNKTSIRQMMLKITWVFIMLSFIAALYALLVVKLFPLSVHIAPPFASSFDQPTLSFSEQLVNTFSVQQFSDLFSPQHLMALIIFAILSGIAGFSLRDEWPILVDIFTSAEQLCLYIFNLLMRAAPLGFFAYFAVIAHDIGPLLFQDYFQIALLYYLSTIIFFFGFYSLYAYAAGKSSSLQRFWQYIWLPALTAIATCSSAASIPANLQATKKMGVPLAIVETAIPLGSMLHKEGSIIGGMFKIAFLFTLYQLPFQDVSILVPAIFVSIMVGTVMGAIPSGGMLGELLILSVYQFPPAALMSIAAISLIIDIPATLLNVTGNTVATLLIAGKNAKKEE